jgi:hypothetical protein
MAQPDRPLVNTKHLNEIVREGLGIPGWEAARFEVITRGFLVEGAVVRVKTRGRNKGDHAWPRRSDPTWRKVVVTTGEAVGWLLARERATGRCSDCDGRGEVVASVSATRPTVYRTCPRCSGSGHAPGAASPEPPDDLANDPMIPKAPYA